MKRLVGDLGGRHDWLRPPEVHGARNLKKALALVATTVLLWTGLSASDAHAATWGTYPTRKGVILVTKDSYSGSAPLGIVLGVVAGHAAMTYNTSYVAEALANGVQTGQNNWWLVRKNVTAVTTYGTTLAQDAAAGDWAWAQRGKPYNAEFFHMEYRHKFYCSQLVWAAFKDKYNIDLNTSWWDIGGAHAIAPTELISTPKAYKVYTKS